MRALFAFAAVAVLVGSCKSGGIEGESCISHGDCSSGLVCQGGVCRTGVANFQPTGKVCVTPQCTVDAQCNGSEKCVGEKCTCMVDSDCFFGSKCSSGACVECLADADCGNGRVCTSGVCTTACMTDGDCGRFEACESSKCVFVGCLTDRECALADRDVRSRCDMTSKACFVPCSSDVECGDLTAGQWTDLVCYQQKCQLAGCEADADCVASGQPNARCVTTPTP
jgi:Cys-rich repeat protein